MACSADQSRRRLRPGVDDEIEEGEIVPGYDTGSDTEDDDDSRYAFQPRHDDGRPEVKRRCVEDIVAIGGKDALLPAPTSSCGSDETISDGHAGAAALEEAFFPCPVCQREFRSNKAVHGHMRVHDPHGRQGQDKGKQEQPVVMVSRGWAVTGKRGFIRGRAVSVGDEKVGDSMAIVIAEPTLHVMDPMPMAFARANLPSGSEIVHESSSAEYNADESMAIVVVAPNPPNQVAVHPPAPPQFVAYQPPALQPAGAQGQHAAPPARDQDGRWYCKEKECNKWFDSHQGLGGHMAGHKLRQNAAAGVHQGGAVACSSGSAKPPKTHACKTCGKVLPSGVALGGHMRKHYNGKVIPKKRGACSAPAAVEGPEFAPLALSSAEASPASAAPAMEVAVQPAETASVPEPAAPAHVPVVEAARPVPAGSIRLFGVTMVEAAPAAEEASSGVTHAESSAASTNSNSIGDCRREY